MILYSVFGDYGSEGHWFFGSFDSHESAKKAMTEVFQDILSGTDPDCGFFIIKHEVGQVIWTFCSDQRGNYEIVEEDIYLEVSDDK